MATFNELKAQTCTFNSCQLVLNGGFEDATNCFDLVSSASVDCWFPFILSPDLFSRGCSQGTFYDIPTYIQFPNSCPACFGWVVPNSADVHTLNGGNGGDHFIGLMSGYGQSGTLFTEAIQTPVNHLEWGRTYTLSFVARAANKTPSNQQPIWEHSSILSFYTDTSTYPMSAPASNNIMNGYSTNVAFNIPWDNQWHSYTIDFTYVVQTNPLNTLIIANTTQVSPGSVSYVFVDDVTLIPEPIGLKLKGDSLFCLNPNDTISQSYDKYRQWRFIF